MTEALDINIMAVSNIDLLNYLRKHYSHLQFSELQKHEFSQHELIELKKIRITNIGDEVIILDLDKIGHRGAFFKGKISNVGHFVAEELNYGASRMVESHRVFGIRVKAFFGLLYRDIREDNQDRYLIFRKRNYDNFVRLSIVEA